MRTRKLTAKHLQLLIALQENPMGRLDLLAKRVDMSRTSVASYLKWLSGESPSSNKQYFRVVPDLDEDALGMQTIDVFFDSQELDAIKQVEKICDDHPYTKYRARCYGGGNKIFAQFRIPKGTDRFLKRYFEGLKKGQLVSYYRILPTSEVNSLFTVPSLEFWDIDTFSWTFNWNQWLKSSIEPLHQSALREKKSKLNLLTKDDIYILSVLPKGARRKQNTMIKELRDQGANFTSQEFSRRLSLLNEHFITCYHVYLDVEAFDLYSNVIITGDCDTEFSNELRSRLIMNPLPFRSTLKLSDEFLFWYLRLPSSHLSELMNYLHPRVRNLQMSIVDYTKTEVYILWPEAFDEESNGWRTDERFLMCK